MVVLVVIETILLWHFQDDMYSSHDSETFGKCFVVGFSLHFVFLEDRNRQDRNRTGWLVGLLVVP